MKDGIKELLQKIPAMDKLLELPWVPDLENELGRTAVKALFSDVMNEIRTAIRTGNTRALNAQQIIDEAKKRMISRAHPSLRSVTNATGVVIHTNLGRSCLAREAAEQVRNVALSYNTLEYSLEAGARGHRNAHVEWLLCQVTGAEAALVVNNNAGAVLLVLAALARGKEVVVSRGELVEIGGSFRIPDIMAFSGAKMVEVGTTNQTHLWDFERALTEESAMLLKVHPSNFAIKGYHGMVDRAALAKLAHDHGLVFVEDLGSGMLVKTGVPVLDAEPTVRDCLKLGVDVVTFSGDKMLGGPQIGCVAGSSIFIDKLRKNPFIRALRVDKMTLAAFETTLRLYIKGDESSIPTLSMVKKSNEQMKKDAQKLARRIKNMLSSINRNNYELSVENVDDAVGGGAFPETPLIGWGVKLRIKGRESSVSLAEKLRRSSFPVVAGIQENKLIFHVRTLHADDYEKIIFALREVLTVKEGS